MDPNQQQDPQARNHHWAPGQNPFFTEPLPNNPQQQNPNQNPQLQTEVYNSPSLAAMPYGSQPAPQPQAAVIGSPVSTTKSKSGGPNKLVLVVVAGLILVAILGIIVLVSSSGSDKKKANTTEQPTATTQSQSLLPAQPIDLEQTNNAISQDMGTLDDEKDFPANSLDDKTLNL